jgi:hypothetical protein
VTTPGERIIDNSTSCACNPSSFSRAAAEASRHPLTAFVYSLFVVKCSYPQSHRAGAKLRLASESDQRRLLVENVQQLKLILRCGEKFIPTFENVDAAGAATCGAA